MDGAGEEGDGAGASRDLLRLVGGGGGVVGAAGDLRAVKLDDLVVFVLWGLRFSVDIDRAEDSKRT